MPNLLRVLLPYDFALATVVAGNTRGVNVLSVPAVLRMPLVTVAITTSALAITWAITISVLLKGFAWRGAKCETIIAAVIGSIIVASIAIASMPRLLLLQLLLPLPLSLLLLLVVWAFF